MKTMVCGVMAWAFFLCGAAAGAEPPRIDAALRDLYRIPAEIPFPAGNLFSAIKAALGEKLFYDPLLSGSRTLSCASCHRAERAWGDGRARAVGRDEKTMALRTPTLIDIAWVPRFGWDGKFRDLESVAFTPITSPGNMNLSETDLLARLAADPDYVRRFTDSFGDPKIDRRRIELALATFERSIVATDAPFDRWIAGEETAIVPAAKRGFALFNGRARCAECHSGFAFTDGSFHDIGTARDQDIGRGRLFPTSIKLKYAFKTPTLRDVALRAPYMHDGSVPTLEAVIDLYDKGGIARPSRAEAIGPLMLSAEEKGDLLAFLQSLTSRSAAAAWSPAQH
jgi:cytochrome c peroxidase